MSARNESIAIPKAGSGPGVLLLHSWWGLNNFFRALCRRFGDAGFVTLAADLYDGEVATTIEGAKSLRAKIGASRKEAAYKYLIRMLRLLATHEAVTETRLGVVGFSMGGHWAYWLAQRPELPIAATVSFYAARNGDYSASASAFLGHFAASDPWVSDASVRKLRRSLEAAGRDHAFHRYSGTSHWFFERDRPDAFNSEASELAWLRTGEFLEEALKPTRRSGIPAKRNP